MSANDTEQAKRVEQITSQATLVPRDPESSVKHDVKSIVSMTALTATAASQLIPTDALDDWQSITSFATTARGLDGSKVEFPTLPKAVKPMKHFECPYCFTIHPAKYQKPRAWMYVHLV